eukprot:COSAG02_NODE_24_length_52386_cov_726.042898_18_plen_117_part_00
MTLEILFKRDLASNLDNAISCITDPTVDTVYIILSRVSARSRSTRSRLKRTLGNDQMTHGKSGPRIYSVDQERLNDGEALTLESGTNGSDISPHNILGFLSTTCGTRHKMGCKNSG